MYHRKWIMKTTTGDFLEDWRGFLSTTQYFLFYLHVHEDLNNILVKNTKWAFLGEMGNSLGETGRNRQFWGGMGMFNMPVFSVFFVRSVNQVVIIISLK